MKTSPRPKIVFIEPKAPNLHIFSKFVIPRLGTLILATIMKKLDWDARVIIEENEELDFDCIESADIVGISTITSTAPRAYTLADQIREMGIPVIMGGPHVSYLPEEALEHCDFVFRGEAETALPLFIKEWQTTKNFSEIPNLSYKANGKIVQNPMGKLNENLDALPYPDFSLIKDGIKRTFGYKIVPFQTSRGCPFHCEFCSVTGMFGKKLRYRSTKNIIDELKEHDDKKNIVFFYDDNFTANRKRAKELLQAMIKEKFKFQWSTQVRADVANDLELVKLMREAGCTTVFIGFESIDAENLKDMKKQQSVDDIKNAIKLLDKNNIHVHGMFVFGFENDKPASIKETIRFVANSQISSVQFLILTPFPGTATFEKLKRANQIKFFDWTLYDAHHAVFETSNLTIDQIQRAQIKGHQSFYSLRHLARRGLKFNLESLLIGIYARKLNRTWKKKNETWLKVLELLKPNFNFNISIDFRQIIKLPRKFYNANKESHRHENATFPTKNHVINIT